MNWRVGFLTGSSNLRSREKNRMKSTAEVLVMVYLQGKKTEMNPAAEEAATKLAEASTLRRWKLQSCAETWQGTHKLMVMKRKLQLESPMSRAVAKAARGRERERGIETVLREQHRLSFYSGAKLGQTDSKRRSEDPLVRHK